MSEVAGSSHPFPVTVHALHKPVLTVLSVQTYLLLNNTPIRLVPSTNHASPTGSLPYLLPPSNSSPTGSPPRPIPSSRLETYVSPNNKSSPSPREEAYQTLLDTAIRSAWLHALYLSPLNTSLLEQLYINPTSSSPLVRLAIRHQLRSAAEEQVVKSTSPTTGTNGWRLSVGETVLSADTFRLGKASSQIDPGQIYAEAEDAFAALGSLLSESETGWFFGRTEPGVFDAAVFAYTCLVGGREQGGLAWGDGGRLGKMVERAGGGELVRHRARIWEFCFGDRKQSI